MATFEEQVEGLTSIAIDGSSTPTQNELSQFLKDGVIDVTDKHLAVRPTDEKLFMAKTASQQSQGANLNGAKIISVLREQSPWHAPEATDADDSAAWIPCRQINQDLVSSALDKSSLNFASVYHPVYWIDENNGIRVLPLPAADAVYIVYYVNNTPQNSSGSALVYSHSDIKFFPSNKVHLVVVYASIKTIEAKLASLTLDEEDVELSSGLQITLQQLQNTYMQGFLPDKNLELVMQSQAGNRR